VDLRQLAAIRCLYIFSSARPAGFGRSAQTLCSMKFRPAVRRNLVIAATFCGFILFCLAGAMFVGFIPSFERKCVQQCKPLGLDGRMVPRYPREMTGARGGPNECKCFSPGTSPAISWRARCTTRRSSGPPPSGRATLAVYFQLRAASWLRPLSFNV